MNDYVTLSIPQYDNLIAKRDELRTALDKAADEITALHAENERLRAALEWYAKTFCEGPDEVCGKLTDDRCSGCKARAALKEERT